MRITDEDLVATLSTELGDDGPVVAAVYARMPTAVSRARWLGPLGNYLVARPAAALKANRVEEATDLPLDAAVVLALTAQELHVWKADPMLSTVGDHLGSVPRSRLSGLDGDVGKSWWPLRISLDGGEVVELEARGDVRGLLTAHSG